MLPGLYSAGVEAPGKGNAMCCVFAVRGAATTCLMQVAECVVTRPTLHAGDVTVGELRAFVRDDHMHAALHVERGRLIGAVDRSGTHLLGLLCLEAGGHGFCSDDGVANRRRGRNCVLQSEEWIVRQPTPSLPPHVG